ncbi:PAS domain S-box protein [Alkalihalobacterium alkalinitrilicum]|uniref:PAS domain S-box protein n=1 Tax=Alkalihalobacterium alkalinitrilicum TaxID=427920 RepID=UPI000995B714|nr:PAS domain S-box protein [Alkalihalobacterium alkalinitrilicum]
MKQLEEMYHTLNHFCNQSPIPMLAITNSGLIISANTQVNCLLNNETDLVDGSIFDFIQEGYHDYIVNSFVYLNKTTQPIQSFEVKTKHKKWLKLHSRIIKENNKTYNLLSVEDITKQKQRDLMLELNQEILKMIVKRESLHNMLSQISILIEEYFVRKSYCSIILVDQNIEIKKVVAPNLPKEFTQSFYNIKLGERGSCGAAMYRKERVIVPDISTDPLWNDFKDHALSIGVRACWSIPIFIDEEVVGSFAIYHPFPSTPTSLELEMLETCANLVGLAIERAESEKRLIRETEKRFKFVMDLIPDLIVFKDDQGGWLEGNRTAVEKLKLFHKKDIDGTKTLHPDYEAFISEVEKTDQLAWELGTPIRRELILPQPNGEEEVYDIIKVPLNYDHILSKGIVVIGREITERKKTVQLLERKQQQFQSLFDNNPNGISIMNLDGDMTSCNRSLEQILGYEFSDLKEYCEYLNQEEAEKVKRHFTKALEGKSQHFEMTVSHKNGNKVYLNLTHVPIVVQETVIGVYAIVEDITEKTKSEEQLKQTKNFLESLIYHSADCIGTLSLEGEILHVNPAIENIYGWKLEEIIGKKFPVLPIDQQKEMEHVISEIKEGKDIIGLETKRQRKDGTIIDVSITYSPLSDETGQLFGFTSVSRDISDRKRTDELLNRSDKLSVIGQLSAAVAHEIRNPLTSIKGFIQLFRDRIKKEYTDLMLSELERIEVIVTEFLSLAKPQANNFSEKDPALLLKNTLAIIDTEALLNQIEIQCTIDDNIHTIFCNEHKIKQVLINILKNAIESMPEGGNLEINMENKDPYVIIQVHDQGCGIDKEKIEKLGEPFYSSKDHGTGLGLMVCFKIIEEHNGHIVIESEEGVGTTVSISLPISNEDNEEKQKLEDGININ